MQILWFYASFFYKLLTKSGKQMLTPNVTSVFSFKIK